MVATTTFSDDLSVPITTFPASKVRIPSGITPISDPGLKAFFEKPYMVATGSWSSASTANTDVTSFSPEVLLRSTAYYTQKHAGYRWFRGTVCVRVVVNAQPFQQGRLLLRYLPFESERGSQWAAAKNFDLTTKSQQPNVELDCRDGSCEMKIPYLHPLGWLDIKGSVTSGWGGIFLTVLSSLEASGATSAQYTMFVWFEDVEFAGATFPQSGIKKRIVAKGRVNREEEEMQDRPVTSALVAGASALRTLAGIPLISSYTSFASNIVEGAAKLTSHMGWSKPQNDENASFYVQRPYRQLCNSSGYSYGESCSLTTRAQVSPVAFAGTDVDEMAFDYIKAIPAYWQTLNFGAASPVDTSLLDTYIYPFGQGNLAPIVRGLTTFNVETMPPYANLAKLFMFAKGGIRLHIKIVKTDFHSGRLMITWTPTPTTLVATNSPATVTDSVYSVREIFDVRDTTDMIITLPYQSPTPWLRTNQALGKIKIMVVNPLIYGGNTSTSIRLVLYTSAAEDFQLSAPAACAEAHIYQAQSGIRNLKKHTLPVGISNEGSCTRDTIGEEFYSIKQILSRGNRMWFGGNGNPQTGTFFRFNPFVGGAVTSTGAGLTDNGRIAPDVYSFLRSAFALERGSVNIAAAFRNDVLVTADYSNEYAYQSLRAGTTGIPWATVVSSAAGGGTSTSIAYTNNVYVAPGNPTISPSVTMANMAVFQSSLSGVYINCPHYSMAASRFTALTGADSDLMSTSEYLTFNPCYVTLSEYPTRANGITIFRSTGEDYQLGLFCGFHPTLYSLT